MPRLALTSSLALSVALGLGAPAMADSLTPATFSTGLALGDSTSILDKIGLITAGTPTGAQADVFFLTDTTGSMSGEISTIQSTFAATVTALAGIGNVATGAGQYKDATNSPSDGFDYQLDQAITINAADTQTAINGWTASGGGDTPEQGLFALTQASGAATGWRAGSKRIIVMTGDAPSHDDLDPVAAGGATVANTATALVNNAITLEALDAGALDSTGQITGLLGAGVPGTLTNPFPDAGSLTALLTSLIGSAFATYSDVSLDLVGPAPSCVSVALPAHITGSFDRSIDRSFAFDPVGLTGIAPGTCSFQIGLFADGALLATEADTVTVRGTAVPEPLTVALFGAGLMGVGVSRRRAARG
jgi:hypothetical protein